MKNIIAIKPHSFIDIITNSSTELFVSTNDMDIETVKEILKRILDGYNIMTAENNNFDDVFGNIFKFDLVEYRKERKEWINKNTEKDPIYFYSKKFPSIHGWFYDLEDEKDLEYLRKDYIKSGASRGGWWSSERDEYKYEKDKIIDKLKKENKDIGWRDAERKAVDIIYNEILNSKDEKPDWWIKPNEYNYHNTPIAELDNCIIIIGAEDNSIPYNLFSIIDNQLNGFHIHCG